LGSSSLLSGRRTRERADHVTIIRGYVLVVKASGAPVLSEARFEGHRSVIPRKHVAIFTCMDARIDDSESSAS
jgi:hypothetical protein